MKLTGGIISIKGDDLMSRVRNYWVVSFMLVLLLNGLALAEQAPVDINRAIELAQQENIELAIAGLELANAELDYQKNKLSNLATASKVVELQGELARINARENYRQLKNRVIIDTIGQFLQLIQLDSEIAISEEEVELQRRRLQGTEAQVEVGYKGLLDLFEQQREYQKSLIGLEKARDDLQQQLKELRMAICLKQEEEILLPKLEEPKIWELAETASIKTALDNNSLLGIKERQITLADANLNRARVADTPKLDLERLENELELAKFDLVLERQKLETAVQRNYYLYKQAIKNMDITRKTRKQALENLKIIKEQEAAGLVTKNDLLEARVSLLKAEKEHLAGIINYYIKQLQLKEKMGLEVEVVIDVREEH